MSKKSEQRQFEKELNQCIRFENALKSEKIASIQKYRFDKAMKLAKELEERDYESTENKLEVYQKSSARYELISKLALEGIL